MRLRLVDRAHVEATIDGRVAVLQGELLDAPDVTAFWLTDGKDWYWSNGEAMTRAEVARTLEEILRIGPDENWAFYPDTPRSPSDPPARASFEFKGFSMLVFRDGSFDAQIPGTLRIERGRPHFTTEPFARWTDASGAPLAHEAAVATARAMLIASDSHGVELEIGWAVH